MSRYLIGWKKIKYNKIANSGMGITILKSELTDEYTEGYTPVYSATKEDKYFGYLENPKLLLQKDDLIIPARGNSIGHVKIAHEIVSTTQTTIYSRINQEIAFPKFIYYVSLGMKDIWFDFTNTAIPQITVNQINNNELYLPNMIKQKKICKILDGKIGNINDIIFLTKCSIEELKKYKQSLITEVVTKGLDKNVEMKDSGIKIIGDIKKSYKIIPLKYIGSFQNGISKPSDYFGEGDPFISYGDVYNNRALPKNVIGLAKSSKQEQIQYSVEEGDIFFTRTSETLEEIAFSSICFKTIPKAVFSGFVIRFRPYKLENINLMFLSYYLESEYIRHYFAREMNIVTRASLSQSLLGSLPIIQPSIEEQQEIVDYIHPKIKNIDSLIRDKYEIIKEYESYKKSLIYEYVTGKKEVGEEVE